MHPAPPDGAGEPCLIPPQPIRPARTFWWQTIDGARTRGRVGALARGGGARALPAPRRVWDAPDRFAGRRRGPGPGGSDAVSYTHLRAHETRHDLVCRLLLEKKKNK